MGRHDDRRAPDRRGGALQGTAILLLCTYRPGYRAPWVKRSYATQLSLPPLTAGESAEVVRGVLGGSSVPRRPAEVVVENAEGNPFFAEELARAIRERQDPAAEAVVPDTIHDALMARVDRLPDAPTSKRSGRRWQRRTTSCSPPPPDAAQSAQLARAGLEASGASRGRGGGALRPAAHVRSLSIHEGRSVPFAEAQLDAALPMVEAITEARAALDVRPECDVRILRGSA